MKGHNASRKAQTATYVITDWITTSLAFLLFNVVRFFALYRGATDTAALIDYLDDGKILTEQAVIPLVILGFYWLSGYYNRPFGKSRLQELVTTLLSALLCTVLIYLALLTNDLIAKRSINWGLMLVLFSLLFTCVYAGRLIITTNARKQFRLHNWQVNVLIVGNSPASRSTAANLRASTVRFGYNVLGYVSIPGEENAADDISPIPLSDIEEAVRRHSIDVIVISPERYDDRIVLDLLYRLFPLNVPIKIAPDTLSLLTSNVHLQDIFGEPFVDLTTPAISESAKNVKRLMDVVLSSLAMIVLSPLYAVVAAMVKADSRGPVVYSQERIGYRQCPFRIYKFRTMRTDAEASGPMLSSDCDPRVTRVGRVLRKYRLDETLQFWNVLRGDMSLVGPRPEREYYIRQIVKEAPYYSMVHQVRPGITGWGMVKYGYASTLAQMVKRTRYDIIYLSNMSLAVDLKIMIYTVKTILSGRGK